MTSLLEEEDLLLLEENTVIPTSSLPSLLEISYVDSTSLSLQQSLKYILETIFTYLLPPLIYHSNHRRINDSTFTIRILKIKDFVARIISILTQKYKTEMRFLITWTIESWFLHSKSCATFAESFYDLRRCKVSTSPSSSTQTRDDEPVQSNTTTSIPLEPLCNNDKTRAAFLLSFFPYIKEKLDSWYEHEKIRRIDSRTTTTTREEPRPNNASSSSITLYPRLFYSVSQYFSKIQENVSTWFFSIYPMFHMSHEGLHFAYRFTYLIGRTVYACPYSHLLGQVVRRVTLEDMKNHSNNSPMSISPFPFSEKGKNVLSFLFRLSMVYGFTSYLTAIVKYEIRRIRRRQVAQGSSSTTAPESVQIPPPQSPKIISNQERGISSPLPMNKTLCPLCHRKRLHPVAASSGYVFCFRCLVMHLRTHGPKCPLTGLPCSESSIIRLYEPTAPLVTSTNTL